MRDPARPLRWKRYLPVALVLFLSLSLTAAAFLATRRSEQRRRESAFRQLAARPAAAVQESVYLHISDLQSIGSFYDASNLVERAEFHSFVSGILARRPGIVSLEWAPRVPAGERNAFEATARGEAQGNFQIVELRAGGRHVPAGSRDVYYPVWYAEPARAGADDLGLDLASQGSYHQALLRAAGRDGVAATVPLIITQGGRKEAYVALALPIHAHGTSHAVDNGVIQGFVVAVLRVRDLVTEAVGKTAAEAAEVSLYDERAGASGVELYPNAGREGAESRRKAEAALGYETRLQVAGREWTMECRPSAAYLASFGSWVSWAVLGVGLVLSGLLSAFVTSVLGRAAWAERLVTERTAELSHTNVRLHEQVAERERAEEGLAARNRELESFVYMASHDLRNPLTSIEGFSRLLEESYSSQLDAEGQEFVRRVRENTAHMSSLVEDLLELARVTSNQEPTDTVAVAEVVAQVLAELHDATTRAGAKIVVPEDLPTVTASPLRLRQVFLNLISNGMKFSREGVPPRVEIAWERMPKGYRFQVKDNGIGIPEEHRARVFEIFTRLKDKDVAGTGIGLAIVKRIVENHGGEVGVESAPGEGSTFWFTVPNGKNGERG